MATEQARIRVRPGYRPDVLSIIGIALVVIVGIWLLVNFIKDPADFYNLFLIGLTNGAVYGLVALGYSLVYGILELINFAHGDVFMLGGMLVATMVTSWALVDKSGVVLWLFVLLMLLIAMAFCATINTTIEIVAYRPLTQCAAAGPPDHGDRDVVHPPEHRADLERRSPDVGAGHPPDGNVFTIGGVPYTWNKFIVILFTVPVLLALMWLVQRTRHGKAMRATAQDRDAAAMMGISVNRTISFTFLIAGASRGRRRAPVRALLHEHPLHRGLPRRADRLHCGCAGRDRQPPGRGSRRARDRIRRGFQQRPRLARPRERLEPVDHLRDPDPDPRLPARRAPRGAHSGGRLMKLIDDVSRAGGRAPLGMPRDDGRARSGSRDRRAPRPVRPRDHRLGSRSAWSSRA